MLDKNATNHGFICYHCGESVDPAKTTARNHCPHCLWSLHVDAEIPGDRMSDCGGAMAPVALYQDHGEWVVVHCCQRCSKERPNKLTEDDNFDTAISLTQNKNG